MQVTETLSSGLKREFKVVASAAELGKELDSKLHEMAGRANIKGFRPGKVPVPHLKRMYGKALMAEVVQKTIDDQSKQVLAERNLKPAYQPEVKLPEEEKEVNAIMAGESDFAFSLAFEIIPTFELKDVSGVELTRHVVEISDAQVDEALGRLTAQYKSFEAKEGKAAKGDKVTIGFVGKVDGKVFDGGTAEDVPLELGSGQFIPGFEDQLIGAKAGDERLARHARELRAGVCCHAQRAHGLVGGHPLPDDLAVSCGLEHAPTTGRGQEEVAVRERLLGSRGRGEEAQFSVAPDHFRARLLGRGIHSPWIDFDHLALAIAGEAAEAIVEHRDQPRARGVRGVEKRFVLAIEPRAIRPDNIAA